MCPGQQNRFLQALAIRELEGQKQRIATYQIQARYELAAIYDRAANDKPKATSHDGAGIPRRRARRGARWPSRLRGLSRSAAGHAANKNPPTIKDLDSQQVDVNTDPPKNVDANKTMDSYKRFLDLNAGDAALRAEALRRLGDLNLESSESERIERELVTNEGLRATEAIHLYSALLKTYPKYERNDSVLYQLARAYELNAQPDKALASLDQLVAKYPNSHYIDEAQFRRGELLFIGQGVPARRRRPTRRSSRSAPSSAFYNQSLYKHGWSLFKQGENERSLDSFAGVLDSVLVSKRDPTELIELETLSRPNRELVEDTFRVMSITFSYLDGPKTIDEFVKRHTPPGRLPRPYSLLYARLGDLYMEKERYTDAADSYRAFVSQDRNNEKAPLLEMQAIEAYSKGGFPQLVLQGKKEFVENYSFGTAYWQGRDPKNEPKVVAVLQDQPQGRGAVLSRPGAAHQGRGGLSGSGEMVSQLFEIMPRRSGFGGHQLSCWPTRCSRASNIWMPPRNTKAPPTTTAINEKAAAAGYAAIIAYGKQEETLSGRAQGGIASQGSRQFFAIRRGISRSPGKRASADAGGHRAICRQGLSARDRLRRKHCWRSSRKSTPANNASPGR